MPRIHDSRVKLARADRHIKELNRNLERFLQSSPYSIISQFDPELPGYRLWGKVHRQLRQEWTALLGDAIHNLRAALDNIAWDLAGHPINDNLIEFPIFDTEYKFEHNRINGTRKMRGMSTAVQDIIIGLQPYKSPHGKTPDLEPLWLVQRLDIEDKHHRLNLVGATSSTATSSLTAPGLPDMAYTSRRWQPFEDGQELEPLRNFFSSSDPNSRHNVIGTFDVSLDPEGPAKGMALRECLFDCRYAVEEVLVKLGY